MDFRPASSSLDILVVSERIPRNNLERAGLKIRIGELSNLPPYHPFEFHLANRKEGEWYLKRIKELIIETGGRPMLLSK